MILENFVELEGRLVNDPKLYSTSNGKSKVFCSVAYHLPLGIRLPKTLLPLRKRVVKSLSKDILKTSLKK